MRYLCDNYFFWGKKKSDLRTFNLKLFCQANSICALVMAWHLGENYVPATKDSKCHSGINKAGQMAAFECALLSGSVRSFMFNKCTDGFVDMWCWIFWYKHDSCTSLKGVLLICHICKCKRYIISKWEVIYLEIRNFSDSCLLVLSLPGLFVFLSNLPKYLNTWWQVGLCFVSFSNQTGTGLTKVMFSCYSNIFSYWPFLENVLLSTQ